MSSPTVSLVLYLESAPAQGASFPVRTTMSARCANGQCADIVAAEYNVEVAIVRAPDQTARRANSDGDRFDSGALNIPAEVPESNLNFQEAAGTDPDNRFTVDPNTGAVRSAVALPAGGYTVTVIYTAAPALLGTLTTELQIESAATNSPGLFGDQDIIDDIEVKADDHELEADSDLRASYGGTRRGLEFCRRAAGRRRQRAATAIPCAPTWSCPAAPAWPPYATSAPRAASAGACQPRRRPRDWPTSITAAKSAFILNTKALNPILLLESPGKF